MAKSPAGKKPERKPDKGPKPIFDLKIPIAILDVDITSFTTIKVYVALDYWSRPANDGTFDRVVARGMKALAEDLSISRDQVKRALKQLRDTGLIKTEGTQAGSTDESLARTIYRLPYRAPSKQLRSRLSTRTRTVMGEQEYHVKKHSSDGIPTIVLPASFCVGDLAYLDQPTPKAIGFWRQHGTVLQKDLQVAVLALASLAEGGKVFDRSAQGFFKYLLDVLAGGRKDKVPENIRAIKKAQEQVEAGLDEYADRNLLDLLFGRDRALLVNKGESVENTFTDEELAGVIDPTAPAAETPSKKGEIVTTFKFSSGRPVVLDGKDLEPDNGAYLLAKYERLSFVDHQKLMEAITAEKKRLGVEQTPTSDCSWDIPKEYADAA